MATFIPEYNNDEQYCNKKSITIFVKIARLTTYYT